MKIFLEAVRSDSLVFWAGSLFVSQSFFLFWFTVTAIRLTKGSRIKIVASGVSVGPIHNRIDRFFARAAFRQFDLIGLRDRESQSYLDLGNYFFSNDIALPHVLLKSGLFVPNNSKVGVSVNSEVINSIYYENLISYLKESNEFSDIICLVPCIDSEDGDDAATTRFIADLENSTNKYNFEIIRHNPKNSDVITSAIGSCGFVFASRMHVGIVSAGLGVPFLQFAYAPKVVNVFSSLDIQDCIFNDKIDFNEQIITAKFKDFSKLKMHNCAISKSVDKVIAGIFK